MARTYSSFVIRCWTLSGGRLRVAVEHVQSGGATRSRSLEAALAWIEARRAAAPIDPPRMGDGADDGGRGDPGRRRGRAPSAGTRGRVDRCEQNPGDVVGPDWADNR